MYYTDLAVAMATEAIAIVCLIHQALSLSLSCLQLFVLWCVAGVDQWIPGEGGVGGVDREETIPYSWRRED